MPFNSTLTQKTACFDNDPLKFFIWTNFLLSCEEEMILFWVFFSCNKWEQQSYSDLWTPNNATWRRIYCSQGQITMSMTLIAPCCLTQFQVCRWLNMSVGRTKEHIPIYHSFHMSFAFIRTYHWSQYMATDIHFYLLGQSEF